MTSLPGIGKTLEEKLKALDETGDIPAAVKLRAKFPTGLIAIMHLPGFGAKRAKLLYDELGVDSLEALRAGYEMRRLVRRGVPIRTPTYIVDGQMIWGATARILGDLLERIA